MLIHQHAVGRDAVLPAVAHELRVRAYRRDMEILLISSDEPLPQMRPSARPSKRKRVDAARLWFHFRGNRGRQQPADALAPATWRRPRPRCPQRNTPTNSASSTMFVTPAATVTARPSFRLARRGKQALKCELQHIGRVRDQDETAVAHSSPAARPPRRAAPPRAAAARSEHTERQTGQGRHADDHGKQPVGVFLSPSPSSCR